LLHDNQTEIPAAFNVFHFGENTWILLANGMLKRDRKCGKDTKRWSAIGIYGIDLVTEAAAVRRELD
jgi:hypothetical protein